MTKHIVKADPDYRKKVFRLVLLILFIGFILLGLAIPMLQNSLVSKQPEAAIRILSYILAALLLLPALLSFILIRIGYRSIKERCFPPEGIRLIKDTALLTDQAAVKRGKLMIIFAITLICLCVSCAVYAVSILGSLI